MLPMPPRMIMLSTMIEIEKSNWNGSITWSMLAHSEPAKPENEAPMANASSFVCTRSMPIAEAASSSSRIAIHARPMPELPIDQGRHDGPANRVHALGAVGPLVQVEEHPRHDLAER